MAHRLHAATLFNLEGTQIEIRNQAYILRLLFWEKVCEDLGQRRAVFFGEQVSDQVEAVIKLRYEMNPRVCPFAQTSGVKRFAERIFKIEVEALQATADIEATASLLAHEALSQDSTSSYPGGYIFAIVTSKLQGHPVKESGRISEAEGIEIRNKVRNALDMYGLARL